MRTNSRPGGRRLAGGLMMPPDMGPRPCANTGTTANRRSIATTAIELFFLQLTAFFPLAPIPYNETPEATASYQSTASSYQSIANFVSGYRFSDTTMPSTNAPSGAGHLRLRGHFLSRRCAPRRSARTCVAFRIHRYPALTYQIHGDFDRNTRHPGFFVDPAITVKSVLLLDQVFAQIDPLDHFQHRCAIVFECLIHIRLRHPPRNGPLRSNQWTGIRHLRTLVFIQERVHPDDDEVNHDADDGQTDHEGEDAARPQVFVFVLGFVASVARAHDFVTHIVYSCD